MWIIFTILALAIIVLLVWWARQIRRQETRTLGEADWQATTDELEDRRRRRALDALRGELRSDKRGGGLAIPPPPSSVWEPGVEEWSRRTNLRTTPGLAAPRRILHPLPATEESDALLAGSYLIQSMAAQDLQRAEAENFLRTATPVTRVRDEVIMGPTDAELFRSNDRAVEADDRSSRYAVEAPDPQPSRDAPSCQDTSSSSSSDSSSSSSDSSPSSPSSD